MSKIVNRVCTGLFLDSVILMQISHSITCLDGVEAAALMIGTPSNLDLLNNHRAGIDHLDMIAAAVVKIEIMVWTIIARSQAQVAPAIAYIRSVIATVIVGLVVPRVVGPDPDARRTEPEAASPR